MVTQRRGKNVAVIGAVLHLMFTAVMVTLWLWTDSLAAMTVSITLGGGVLVWLMVALLFYCRQLAEQERIELAELTARGADAGALFDRGDQGASPAAARAAVVERWVLPVFALIWAAYHATIAIFVLRYLASLDKPDVMSNLLAGIGFQILVGFPMFLFSWYALGMARGDPAWRPLRACGSYMLANVLFSIMALVSFVGAWLDYPRLDLMMAYVIPAVQLILAAELVMNFVLDLYRPRVPGLDRRLSIDSRLLDLLADPGRVGHSIAEFLNYQFGYEVSKTWFYQLVSKAFVPLVILGVVLMFALSSVVIVQDGEEAVVLHWGKDAADRATLGAGIHLKWPWPIDTARRFRVDTVHRILLGAGEQRSREQRGGEFINGREVLLWTQEHGEREELDFVLAVPPKTRREASDNTPPVNVIKLVVLVEYMISDVRQYGYQYTDPREMLRVAAYREMSTYCASATLDKRAGQTKSNRPEAIMTSGREQAAQELRKRIQARANALKLGVRLTNVGLISVHPPSETAAEFEKVLETERRRDETRYKAEGEANEVLAKVAGSAERALSLALAITVLDELEALARARDKPAEFRNKLAESIRGVSRDIGQVNKEIERDRLLGKVGAGKPQTLAERMLVRHRAHEALLTRMKSDAAKFPFGAEITAARKRADTEFDLAVGEPAAEVARAEAARWEAELTERGRYEAVQRERVAWRANPQVYMWDRWLDVWDQTLPGMLKYVLGVDKDRIEVRLNWEREIGAMEGVTFEQPTTPK